MESLLSMDLTYDEGDSGAGAMAFMSSALKHATKYRDRCISLRTNIAPRADRDLCRYAELIGFNTIQESLLTRTSWAPKFLYSAEVPRDNAKGVL